MLKLLQPSGHWWGVEIGGCREFFVAHVLWLLTPLLQLSCELSDECSQKLDAECCCRVQAADVRYMMDAAVGLPRVGQIGVRRLLVRIIVAAAGSCAIHAAAVTSPSPIEDHYRCWRHEHGRGRRMLRLG